MSRLPWLTSLGLVVIAMSVIGLDPRGFPSTNEVMLPKPGSPWLAFPSVGVAYTEPFLSESDLGGIAERGMSTEIALDFPQGTPEGFAAIAVLHSGKEETQWFLGQWKRVLVLMSGDDYANQFHHPRLSANIAKFSSSPILLTITADREGSQMFVDGELVSRATKLTPRIPPGSRLILGNSVSGKQPWQGKIGSLVLHARKLSLSEVRGRCAAWRQTGELPASDSGTVLLSYPMLEGKGRRCLDHSGLGRHLDVPEEATILQREFLARAWGPSQTPTSVAVDVTLNLLGFVPFGFLLGGFLGPGWIRSRAVLLVLVTLAGLSFSLVIEYLQSWLPGRTSSLHDLVWNTLGASLGGLFFLGLRERGSRRGKGSSRD